MPPSPAARRHPRASAGRLAFGVALVGYGVMHFVFFQFTNDTGLDDDPYTVTNPEVILDYLRQAKRAAA